VRRIALPWTPVLSRLLPNVIAGLHLRGVVAALSRQHDYLAIEIPNMEGIGWATVRGPNRWLRMHSPLWEGHASGGTPSSLRDRFIRWLDGVTARRATHLITHSRVHADRMRVECRLGNRPIAVVPHGVPDPGPHPREQVVPGRVLAIGPLWERKGADLLLTAFERLAARIPHLSLTMVGPSPDPRIAAQATSVASRWPGRLRLPGRLDEPSLAAEWQAAEVVVMASRYESFGLVAVEAMARGIPVVLSDAAALPEVGGEAVERFRAGDATDLAAALARVLADATRRRELADLGRRRYNQLFRPEAMGSALLRTFRGGARGEG
jgi:glycosyltransferase involved in cell wall biosynthesis